MIPKKIHYCWFGGKELPELAKKCIASWKEYCPEWEIIQWNESNFPIQDYPYAQYCLENKKWAFLSDMVRLIVVYEHGGVYLDTDVELIRPLDDLCRYEAYYGFELPIQINTGHGFGAEAGQETVKYLLDAYLCLRPDDKGAFPLTPCPKVNTAPLVERGLKLNGERQTIAGAEVFPIEYFNPYEYTTGRMRKTKNTYSIHWFNQSWISPMAKFRSKLTKPFHRLFGVDCFRRFKKKK